MVDQLGYFSFLSVLHDWCNKGRGICYPVWDGAYKKNLAANRIESPMWRQRVSFFTIRMVLNHMSDAI